MADNGFTDKVIDQFSVGLWVDHRRALAPSLLPTVPVKRSTDLIKVYDKNHLYINTSDFTFDPRGKSNEFITNYSPNGQYTSHIFAEHLIITGTDYRDSDVNPSTLRMERVRRLMDRHVAFRERLLQQVLTNTSVMTNNLDLSTTPSDQWSDPSSSPYAQLKEWSNEILKDSLNTPNTLILSPDVWNVLSEHPDSLYRSPDNRLRDVSATEVGSLIARNVGADNLKVYVGRLTDVNSSGQGQFIWNNVAILCYIDYSSSKSSASLLKNFMLEDFAKPSFRIFKNLEGNPDPRTEKLILSYSSGINVFVPEAGKLITNVIA